MPQYNNELLINLLTEYSATLIGTYDKLTIKSRISFECRCGKKGEKNFKRATISGLYCDECTKEDVKRKTKERTLNAFVSSDSYNLSILESCILRDKASINCELPKLHKEARISFMCYCGNEGEKTFKYIKENGMFCKSCMLKTKREKREKTNLEKYGNTCTLQSDTIKAKAEKTCIQKYGVSNAFQSNDIKKKIKATNLQKYGAENPYASKEIIAKIRKTCKDKYGTEFPTQNSEIQGKTKQTNLEKYGVEVTSKADCVKETAKQTNLILYGHEHHILPEIMEKAKKTNLEKFGVEYSFQAESVKEKIKNTMIVRYGVDHNMKSEKVKEKVKITSLEKFGVPHPSQSPIVINKRKATCLQRYGVEIVTQSQIIQEKIQKSGVKYKPYTCPSGTIRNIQGYEHFALDKLLKGDCLSETDVLSDRKEVPRITYTDDTKKRYYFPDILIKSQNKLIEVKSPWTYELHLNTNKLKWKASKDQGYSHEFWIFTPKGELTIIENPEL
jgi:hypothetical protein